MSESANHDKKKDLSFDRLPQAISELIERVVRIEHLLTMDRQPVTTENELLNITEAATFLRLTKSTIYSKVCRGEIPAFKTGRRLYFDRQELTTWIKSSRKTTNEDIRTYGNQFMTAKGLKRPYHNSNDAALIFLPGFRCKIVIFIVMQSCGAFTFKDSSLLWFRRLFFSGFVQLQVNPFQFGLFPCREA